MIRIFDLDVYRIGYEVSLAFEVYMECASVSVELELVCV